jgi:hypothetical protein
LNFNDGRHALQCLLPVYYTFAYLHAVWFITILTLFIVGLVITPATIHDNDIDPDKRNIP